MKVTLPSFLRWGGRRDERPETAHAVPVEAPVERTDRRREARWTLDGLVWFYWVDAESGEVERVEGDLLDVTDSLSGFGADVKRPIPAGVGGWVVSENEAPVPVEIKHCEASETGYRVGAAALQATRRIEAWGSAGVRWIDADGKAWVAPAVVRNAEDGRLEVNVASGVPLKTLVLVEGREAACLCQVRSSEAYGERYLIEVETISEATPVSPDRRAA